MSRFPNTRMALARIFANLSICALPASEKACLGVAFSYADLLHARAHTIWKKGQQWRAEDDETPSPTPRMGGDADAKALEVVEAIFEDLRGRRFLKWIFDERGDECYIADFANGEPLKGLDLEVQGQIKAAWQVIIAKTLAASEGSKP